MKLFSVFVVFILLLLQAFAEAALVASSAEHSLTSVDDEIDLHKRFYHPKKINCNYACSRRCRKASRKKMCLRACKTCCKRCHCVPAGTYGNKNMCPCYARLKTHGHKPKCP